MFLVACEIEPQRCIFCYKSCDSSIILHGLVSTLCVTVTVCLSDSEEHEDGQCGHPEDCAARLPGCFADRLCKRSEPFHKPFFHR